MSTPTPIFDDLTPRYAPTQVMTWEGMRPAVGYVAYPPHQHPPKCPILDEIVALEVITDIGISRWYGCQEAYINSELKMVIIGADSRDEVRMRWPKAKARK